MAGRGERWEAIDIGSVAFVDDPDGVSWLTFDGISYNGYGAFDQFAYGEPFNPPVPVPTSSLQILKNGAVEVGDMYWARVNQAARSVAEVDPLATEYLDTSVDPNY